MDTLAVILMLGLFLLILVFIFSTALLTPLIGKRNLLFVIFLGFTVGAVGGAFLIAPVFDDIPAIANSLFSATSTGTDVVGINASTNINITDFITNTKKIDGVQSVQSNGITIKTDPMSDAWQSTFISRIPDQNSNVTSVTIPSNDTMVLVVKNGTDPQDVINGLQTWMMYVSGLNIKYSIVNITLNVQSSKLNQVISQLPQGDVVITDVSGSTEKNIQNINNSSWVGWNDLTDRFQNFPSGSWQGVPYDSPNGMTGGNLMILQPYPIYDPSQISSFCPACRFSAWDLPARYSG